MPNGDLIDYVTCKQRTHARHSFDSRRHKPLMQMADESSITCDSFNVYDAQRTLFCWCWFVRIFIFHFVHFLRPRLFSFLFIFSLASLQSGPFEKCAHFNLVDLDAPLADTQWYGVKIRLDAVSCIPCVRSPQLVKVACGQEHTWFHLFVFCSFIVVRRTHWNRNQQRSNRDEIIFFSSFSWTLPHAPNGKR